MELSQKTIEHFRNPQNVGEIENPEGTGTCYLIRSVGIRQYFICG